MTRVEELSRVELGGRSTAGLFAGAVAMVGEAVREGRWVDAVIECDITNGEMVGNEQRINFCGDNGGGMPSFTIDINPWGETSCSFSEGSNGTDGRWIETRVEQRSDRSLVKATYSGRWSPGAEPEKLSEEPTTVEDVLAELRRIVSSSRMLDGETEEALVPSPSQSWNHNMVGVRARNFVYALGGVLVLAGDFIRRPETDDSGVFRDAKLALGFNSYGRLYGFHRPQRAEFHVVNREAQCGVDYELELVTFNGARVQEEEFGLLKVRRTFQDRRPRGPFLITRDDLGQWGDQIVWTRIDKLTSEADSQRVGRIPLGPHTAIGTDVLRLATVLRPAGSRSQQLWPPAVPPDVIRQSRISRGSGVGQR